MSVPQTRSPILFFESEGRMFSLKTGKELKVSPYGKLGGIKSGYIQTKVPPTEEYSDYLGQRKEALKARGSYQLRNAKLRREQLSAEERAAHYALLREKRKVKKITAKTTLKNAKKEITILKRKINKCEARIAKHTKV